MSKKTAPTPKPFHIEGVFIRLRYVREYKQKTGQTDGEDYFDKCLLSGVIQFVRNTGLTALTAVYQFKI